MRLVIIAVFLHYCSFAQKTIEPDKILAFNITVNYDDYTVKTQMLKDPQKIRVKNDLNYLWFNSNQIIETKGGFDGKLLHGYYKSFYLNNQLRESGEIKYGTKNREWKSWYINGNLKEISTWKNGRKFGNYELYNDYGNLMAKGKFRNDLLHGRFYTYDNYGKILEIKKYRKGVEIIRSPKKARSKKNVKADKSSKQKENKKKDKVGLWPRIKKLFNPKRNTKGAVESNSKKNGLSN